MTDPSVTAHGGAEQLDLLNVHPLDPTPGRVHRHGLTTEKQAAERVSFRSGSQKALLLQALYERGPSIPHDLYASCRCAYPYVATTRLGELATDYGLVEMTTEKKPTATAEAHAWRLTEKGHAFVADTIQRKAS